MTRVLGTTGVAILAIAAAVASESFGLVAPFALVAGPLVVAVLFRSAFASLLVFVAVLLSRPGDFLPALAAVQPARTFALLAFAVLGLTKVLRRDVSLQPLKMHRWMLALSFAIVASALLGTAPNESMQTVQDAFVKVVMVYVLISELVTTERRAITLQVVIGVLVACIGAYAAWTKVTGRASVEGSRAALVGLLGDPNDLALTLLMATPFLLAAAVESQGMQRLAFAVLGLLSLSGIVSTLSRGGLIGLAGACFLLARFYGLSRSTIAVLLVVFAAPVIAVSGLTDRQSGAVGAGEIDESAQGRLDAWEAGMRMFTRNPILGVGFNRFPENFERYSVNPVFWGRHETHNSYIKCIAETGVCGFIPFMGLIFVAMGAALRLREASLDAPRGLTRAVHSGALPNLAGFLVAAFFLSQCWGWFLYILLAQIAVTERVSSLGARARPTPALWRVV